MRHFFPAAACAICMLAATPARADDAQAWQTITLNVAAGDHVRLSSETTFRSSDAKGFYELEENVMVGYKFGKHLTAWVGYTHDPQYSHGNFTVTEHRIRQQLNFDNVLKLGKVNLGGRLRLEERWRDGQNGTGWRLRPQIKASLPIAGKTTLALSNEPFLNLNTTGFQRVNGLDRMRTSLTVITPLAKRVNLEFGYLNQHGFVRNGADTDDHVAVLGLSVSL